MGENKKTMCYNCIHHKYNKEISLTECNAPQNNKNYWGYSKVKDLFYTDGCPFKGLDENGEYLYWN